MLPRDVCNALIDPTEAAPCEYTSPELQTKRCSKSGERRETVSLFDSSSVLQTRRLMGDTSRKGHPWWRSCQAHARRSGKSSIAEDNEDFRTTVTRDSRDGDKIAQQVLIKRATQTKEKNKVYIVTRKKAQYGHIVSDHGDAARDENRSPIIYGRPERARKEVAPLWFHPFSMHTSNF
eukprot:CCRYP_011027-RA/>CCRYP_011027-RA protein AED:0.15 eAED:0.55 QI:0/0/0.5/1/0/0/2/547/177